MRLCPVLTLIAAFIAVSASSLLAESDVTVVRAAEFENLGTGQLVPLGDKDEKGVVLGDEPPHPQTTVQIRPGPYRVRIYGNHRGRGGTLYCYAGSEKLKFFPRVSGAKDRNKIVPCEFHKNGDVVWPLMVRDAVLELRLQPYSAGGGIVQRIEFVPAPDLMGAFTAERFTWESVSAQLSRPKKLHALTPLVAAGRPMATIVVPDDSEGLASAKRIQTRAKELTGALLPIASDQEIPAAEYGRRHYLALGNLMTNRVIERLYYQRMAYCDARYPGRSGHVVRTCHDPFVIGKNVVVMAGSDPAGVRSAVDAFLAKLGGKQTRDLSAPHILDVRLSAELAAHKDATKPFPPTPEMVEKHRERVNSFGDRLRKDHAVKAATAFRAMAKITQHGQMYLLTGDRRRLLTYREGLLTLAEIDLEKLGVTANTWYMRYIELWNLWDQVEEEEVFSEADRLTVERYLLRQAFSRNDGAPVMPHFYDPSRTGSSHWVAGGFGPAYYGSHYYAKYYDLAWARQVQRLFHTFFWGTDDAFKPNEDATGYQEGAITLKSRRAVFSGETARHLDSGRARRSADLQTMTVTPNGTLPGYGDASGPRGGFIESHINMHLLSWYYKDGRYAWASERCANYKSVHYSKFPVGHYYTNIEPVVPDDHVGLYVFPLDERHWREYLVGKKAGNFIRPEATFDKLTMRTGWERDDDYFLMGGIGYFGIHPHEDANAITRYQRYGKDWLLDDVYSGGSTVQNHCSVGILRDAVRQRLPYLVRCQAARETDSFAYVKGTLEGYGGTDWTRHVFWRKRNWFVVIDDLLVRAPGSYAIECLWRMGGDVSLEGDVAHSQQDEAHFFLANADPSAKKLLMGVKDKPTVHQLVSQEFDAGGRVTFLNAFWAQEGQAEPAYSWAALGPRHGVLSAEGQPTLVGIAEEEGRESKSGQLTILADSFVVSPERVLLWNARALTCGRRIFGSDMPVTVELDLKNGRGWLETDSYARVQVRAAGGSETLLIGQGKSNVSWQPDPEVVRTLAAALTELKPRTETRPESARKIAKAPVLWEHRAKEPTAKPLRVVSGDLDGDGRDEVVVVEPRGKRDYELVTLGADGKAGWSFPVEYAPKGLHVCDADGDGKGEVYVGGHLGMLWKLSATGETIWKNVRPRPEKGGDRPSVTLVRHADLDGDGQQELLIGQRDGKLLVMDAQGNEKVWMTDYAAGPSWARNVFATASPIDLDGDGKYEIFAATVRKEAYVFDRAGKTIAKGNAGWYCKDVRLLDVTGDRQPELLCLSGSPGFKVLDKKFTALYDFGVAPKALGWLVKDVDGDGRVEIIVAASSGYLLCFDGRGGRPWTRHVGDYLSAFCTVRKADGSLVLAGATDDGDVIFLDVQARSLSRQDVTDVGITALHAVEIDGKPGQELVACTREGCVFAIAVRP